MADLIMYYFFHITPLLIVVLLPVYFVIEPLKWGFKMIENNFKH